MLHGVVAEDSSALVVVILPLQSQAVEAVGAATTHRDVAMLLTTNVTAFLTQRRKLTK